MTIEYSAVFVQDLDPELPADSDDLSEGNDHIMLVKQVLQNTFTSATQALVADFEYLNQLPTRILLTNDTLSDEDSTSILAMDMTGNRLKNVADGFFDQDVPSLLQVKNLITEALSEGVFGIGQPFITRQNVNPADILGFGTWVQVSGGIFGAGTFTSVDGTTTYNYEAGRTYGSPDLYLQANQIPEMEIDMSLTDENGAPYVTTSVDGNHNHTIPMHDAGYSAGSGGGINFPTMQSTTDTSTDGNHNHTLVGAIPFGNGTDDIAVVNTMNPINVFYIWERTA